MKESSADQSLRALCAGLVGLLERQGYRIAHRGDIDKPNSIADEDLKRRVKRLWQMAEERFFAGDENDLQQIDMLRKGTGAFCNESLQLVAVQDEEGALDKFAAANGLNTDALRRAGISNLHLYAEYLVHEASHVIGNDGRDFTDKSFLMGEFQVHALAAARSLKAAGPAIRPAMRLLAAAKCQNLPEVVGSHAWALNAIDWVISRLEAHSEIWREDGNGFTTETFNSFARFGNAYTGASAKRPMDLALGAIMRHGVIPFEWQRHDISIRFAMRDAAFDAAEDVKQAARASLHAGKPDKDLFQAHLVLRQMARSLDTVLQYADGYYAKGALPEPPRLPRSIFDLDIAA